MFDKRKVNIRKLENVVAKIAFEYAKTGSLGDNTRSSLEIGFPCTVVVVKSDQPCNIALCSSELGVGNNQALGDHV